MTSTILGTKLFRPPTRPGLVDRPRLRERLNAGSYGKLTLISAPAGFGKTTLVSSWLDTVDRPAAWLSLDQGDNDPTRFLAHLVAASQAIAPNVEALAGALRSSLSPPSDSLLTVLVNEFGAVRTAFTLVLDDYHVVESSAVDSAIAFLLEHAPPHMHLVIATREDPQLPLARLRANGQLTELRAADLRFDTTESGAFLTRLMGLELSAANVAQLAASTEGWVAGLQLAAISLQGLPDATGFIASFSGTNRFVLDYLVEEVLQRQPESVQAFLLRTSVLDRMCGPLCDAVLDDPSVTGEAMLKVMDQANLFVVPLDAERRWFRYHHLFADLLRQRLQQRQRASSGAPVPGADELHARASTWFEENGLALEAFQHAAAANDIARAARLIDGDGVPLHFDGAAIPVLDWLTTLPAHVLDERPSLWVVFASAALFGGQTTGVEEKLLAAEAALGGADPDWGETGARGTREHVRDLLGQIASLRATLAVMRNDVPAIMAQARRALEHLATDNLTVRTAAAWALGHAQQLSGNRAEAGRAFAEVLSGGSPKRSIYTLAAAITSGHLQDSELRPALAEKSFARAMELAGDPPHPMVAEAHLGLARIAYQRNDLEAAAVHGQRCRALLRLMEKVPTVASLHMLAAQIALALGDAPRAAIELDAAEEYAGRTGLDFQLPAVAALRVVALLRQGEVAAAGLIAESSGFPLARARARVAAGASAEAVALCEPLRREAQAKGWLDELLKVTIVEALALAANGDAGTAAGRLSEALVLSEPAGLVRVFLDEGAPMESLLTAAVQLDAGHRYAEALLVAFASGAPSATGGRDERPAPTQPLDDPLSQRELEVLRMIAAGLSNREIGLRLFRAIDTVKGYGRSIFDKLEVNSRTEAVARARELGLL